MITNYYAEVLGGEDQQVCIKDSLKREKLRKRKMVDGAYVPQYKFILSDGRTAYTDYSIVASCEDSRIKKGKSKFSLSSIFG